MGVAVYLLDNLNLTEHPFIVVFLGTLNSQLDICNYGPVGQLLPGQAGCYGLTPIFEWIDRRLITILLVSVITFLPPFVQGANSLACVYQFDY